MPIDNDNDSNAPSSAAAANVSTSPRVDDEQVQAETLRTGSVLARGSSIFARRFVPLTTLTLLVFLPWIAANAEAVSEQENTHNMMTYVAMFLSCLTAPLATGACVAAVVDAIAGRPINMLASLKAAFSVAPSALGASFVQAVIVAFGTALCVVPGLIALSILYVTLPAVVLEKCGAFEALQKSADLTKGRRWSTFALALLPYLTNILVATLTHVAHLPFAVQTGLTSLAGVLAATIGAVFATIAYIDLRSERDAAVAVSTTR